MLMLLLALNAPGGPKPIPAHAVMHYKIVSKTSTTIDLTAMGAPSQNVVMTATGFVSATLTDSAGGKVARITVDSSAFDAGDLMAQLPPEMAASSTGTVYHVFILNGKATGPVTATPNSVQGAQLVAGIDLLLTGLLPTRGVTSWVDTTRADTTMSEGNMSGTRITTWTAKPSASGRTQLDGIFTGTTKVGAGQMSMELQMTGTAKATGILGALVDSATSLANGQANMNIAGQAIPMKVTMEVTTSTSP